LGPAAFKAGPAKAIHTHYYYSIALLQKPVSRTIWISWYQNVKPFWFLLQQQDMAVVELVKTRTVKHAQIAAPNCSQISTANTTALGFLQAGCPSCHQTTSFKALKMQ